MVDELFPLQSCKIRNDDPVIYVTFQKNMTTMDYILGDPKQKAAIQKEKDEEAKREKADKEKSLKAAILAEKEAET